MYFLVKCSGIGGVTYICIFTRKAQKDTVWSEVYKQTLAM